MIIIRAAPVDLRVGVPPPGRFCRVGILFYFAVIGDCRLYWKNKNIEKNNSNPPARPKSVEVPTPRMNTCVLPADNIQHWDQNSIRNLFCHQNVIFVL